MDITLFPTKGNLMLAQNTLALSKQGYELLDKKRNILMREMMALIDKAKALHSRIEAIFSDAYRALESANVSIGINTVEDIGFAVPVDEDIKIKFRSVMGVELPVVTKEKNASAPMYGLAMTNSALDEAVQKFMKVKELTLELAEIETSVYRLAVNIGKTQKRANSLKNIMIPKYEEIVKTIQDVLDEKEREEFSRLKIIKKQKECAEA